LKTKHPPGPLSKGELDHSPLEVGVRGVLISIKSEVKEGLLKPFKILS
jgi:hypothetical protein